DFQAAFEADGLDAPSEHVGTHRILAHVRLDAVVFQELAEDALGDMGFEAPLLLHAIVIADLAIELPRQAADRALVADVGVAQSACRQSADEGTVGYQDDGVSVAGDLHRGRDGAGAVAVDADVRADTA